MKNSTELKLVRGIPYRPQATDYPSMAVKATGKRPQKWRGQNNNKILNNALPEVTGKGGQSNTTDSPEVPLGGNSKSGMPEVQVHAAHATYASLARARVARKAAHEERMLSLRQSVTNSQNQERAQFVKHQEGTHRGTNTYKKSFTDRYKAKPRQNSLMLLGLKRRTRGDFLIASLDAKTGTSSLDNHLRVTQGHVGSSQIDGPGTRPSNTPSVSPGSADESSIAKYKSSHSKSLANNSSLSSSGAIGSNTKATKHHVGPAGANKQRQGQDLSTELTPRSSKISGDNEKTVSVRERVNKDSSSADVVSEGRESNPLENDLEAIDLANILHELESTLNTLRQGNASSEVDVSPPDQAPRQSIGDNRPVIQNDSHESDLGTGPDKTQSGSEDSPKKKNTNVPPVASLYGRREGHRKAQPFRVHTSKQSKEPETKPEGYDSKRRLQKVTKVSTSGHREKSKAASDKLRSNVPIRIRKPSKLTSKENSGTDESSKMVASHGNVASVVKIEQSDNVNTKVSLSTSLKSKIGDLTQDSEDLVDRCIKNSSKSSLRKSEFANKSIYTKSPTTHSKGNPNTTKDRVPNVTTTQNQKGSSILKDPQNPLAKANNSVINNVTDLADDQISHCANGDGKEEEKANRTNKDSAKSEEEKKSVIEETSRAIRTQTESKTSKEMTVSEKGKQNDGEEKPTSAENDHSGQYYLQPKDNGAAELSAQINDVKGENKDVGTMDGQTTKDAMETNAGFDEKKVSIESFDVASFVYPLI